MKIVAHEASENTRRMPRTDFPTHPVCKNAVHNCTAANVARSRDSESGLPYQRSEQSLRLKTKIGVALLKHDFDAARAALAEIVDRQKREVA